MRRRAIALTLSSSLFFAGAAGAGGDDVPALEGHVTDPSDVLSAPERASLEELLGSIQSETNVDVATFVAAVPDDQVEAAGRKAFDAWGIGRAWTNGVLIVVTTDAQAATLALSSTRSAIDAGVAKDIASEIPAAVRSKGFAAAIRGAAGRVHDLVRDASKVPFVRPAGRGHPDVGLRFAIAFGFVALVAIALHVRRARLTARERA